MTGPYHNFKRRGDLPAPPSQFALAGNQGNGAMNSDHSDKERATSFRLGQAAWLRALERTAPLQRTPLRTFPVLLGELADRFGDAPALISRQETVTYRDLFTRSNRYSRWALEQDLPVGTAVGLMMHNCPDYLAIWFGLTRVGCVAALFNTNLSGASLAHCIGIAKVRHLIVSDEFRAEAESALPYCEPLPEVWFHKGSQPHGRSLEGASKELRGTALESIEQRAVTLADRALCIYTSGTTGLPKAANVSHNRIMAWSHWFAGMMDTGPKDRLYNCLPFYHAIGGVAANGAMLAGGGSIFLREKFSASSFWKEVCDYECTLFQYIGELCRYLLNAPISSYERDHRLRLCCGNGLGGDIWPSFKERFQIPHILEFYAATEANFSLYNCDEEPGAIGRIPPFLSHRFPIKLIAMDDSALEPLRNEDGLCIPSKAGEAGEAVFQIAKAEDAGAAAFEGYTTEKDSGKKILRDVFAKGDRWYRSGDLMKRSAKGYFYFVDRIGDTFRWKGENVSTSEVAHVLSACPGVKEAAVYGVQVPKADGRAGMAAVATGSHFDLAALKAHLDAGLPRYAQPLFLRIIAKLDLTATFRPKKSQFAAQGFDPAVIQDELYFNDQGAFVRLASPLYEDIVSGRMKL
jgi:fatty-acyl-CoA synthase